MPSAAFGQPYATAKIGTASADFALGSPYNGVVDDRSFSFGVDAGVAFAPHWAVELGVTKYGSFDGRGTPCLPSGGVCTTIVVPIGGNDMTVYNLALMPHIEVGDVELFAELGYYKADISTDLGACPCARYGRSGVGGQAVRGRPRGVRESLPGDSYLVAPNSCKYSAVEARIRVVRRLRPASEGGLCLRRAVC